jgi:hypothetical protein
MSITKALKSAAKAASEAGETAANVGKEMKKRSDTRVALAQRGKQSASKGPQKAYDRIQAELKWLIENDAAPETIAARRQSLKDMFVNNVIKKKPMDEVTPVKPAGYKKGGAVTKKTAMMRGGMANGKTHMYAAGGSVMDNLTAGQRRMVRAMAADNKK